MQSPDRDVDHDLVFTAEYDDDRTASLVSESLGPAVAELEDERSRTRITRDGRHVTVHVQATDAVALRAASNTWLTFVDVAERTITAGRHVDLDA